MRIYILAIILLNSFIFTIQTCNRKPQAAIGPTTPVADDFQVLVGGNPTTYVAGQKYTISISCTSSKRFITFTLIVENENGTIAGEENVGHFELIDTVNTRFSHNCENMIESTNINAKTHIDVIWIAPRSFESGCIKIKAAVMEHRNVWFMDDGLLIKQLCPEINEMNSQTTPLQFCCARDEAKYELRLERIWSRNTHVKYFPSESWRTRFSALVGASHTYDFRFWDAGTLASAGLQELAEHGSTTRLEQEIKAGLVNNNIRTIIKAPGIVHRHNVLGMTLANVRVDTNHHLISIVTKIEPSPDWILGVAGLELCLENCTWVEEIVLNMYPWDVGTDSGPSYMSPDQAQIPPDVVRRITKSFPSDHRSPFFDESTAVLKPLAILYVTRKKVYARPDEDSESGNMECATHPWTSWTKCSTLCGTGQQTRWRAYKEPRLAQSFGCNITLNQAQTCVGSQCSIAQAEEEPAQIETRQECELSEWSEWSTCSNNCGEGFARRSRYYFNVNAKNKCQRRYPMELEQSRGCMGENCGGNILNKNENEETESEPELFGNLAETDVYGNRDSEERQRYDDKRRKPQTDVYSRPDSEERDMYDDKRRKPQFSTGSELNDNGIVPAYCLEWPEISNVTCRTKQLTIQNYWFYDASESKCMLFTTDNCDQNQNKFNSLELCENECLMPHLKSEDSNGEYNENQWNSNFGQPESQIRYNNRQPNRFAEYNENQWNSNFGQPQSQIRYDNKNNNRFGQSNENLWNTNFVQPESQVRNYNKKLNRLGKYNENERNANFVQPQSQIRNFNRFTEGNSNFAATESQDRYNKKENQWNSNYIQSESQIRNYKKNYNRFGEYNENQWSAKSQQYNHFDEDSPTFSANKRNRNEYF